MQVETKEQPWHAWEHRGWTFERDDGGSYEQVACAIWRKGRVRLWINMMTLSYAQQHGVMDALYHELCAKINQVEDAPETVEIAI